MTTAPPQPMSTAARSTRRWLALAVLALAQFLVVLDASIVNIAIPALGNQLHLGAAGMAWVITAYVLPFGGLLLLGGRLADRLGHRRVFLVGTAGFTAASALAGLSWTSSMLFVARALQGTSAALLAPAALALLAHLFVEPRERATALGVWGGVAGIGSAAGVLLGGILTALLGWQFVFFVNVPIGIAVVIVLPALVTPDAAQDPVPLDLAGSAAITGALVAIVGTLSAVQQLGFRHPLPIALAAITVLLVAAFAVVERRSPRPLIPLSVLRNRNLSAGNVVMLMLGAAMVPLFFALSVFLQRALGYGAMATGLSQLPLAGALVVAAGVVPPVVARFGTRPTLVTSLVVLAAGLLWLATAPSDAAFAADLLGPTLMIGTGIGGAFVTTTQLAVDGVDGVDGAGAGLAGGLVNTSQQVGGALGLAILASLAAGVTTSALAHRMSQAQALTAGFAWLFVGAAVFALLGAAVAVLLRPAGTSGRSAV